MRLAPGLVGLSPNYGLPIGPLSVRAPALLDLQFAAGGFGQGGRVYGSLADVPGYTFARASEGRSLDGTLNFASGVPRIVPGLGILIEEARTNLFLNSSAPATQNVTLAVATYTVTVWGSGSVAVSAGTATATGYGTASAGSPVVIVCTGGGTIVCTVSGTPTYVQVELGTFGTSPIVTAGTSVTRAADDAVITGLVLPSAGTLIVEAQAYDATSVPSQIGGINPNVANLSNSAAGTEVVGYNRGPTSNVANSVIRSGGSVVAGIGTNVWANGTVGRAAIRYATNDFAASFNGGAVETDTSGSQPTGMTRLHIGQGRTVGTGQWCGYIRRITVLNRLMSNAELQGASA